MAECIVKAPKDATMDYDYIAFSFNGLHSYEDFGIYRISDGDRYNDELVPTTQDLTAEVPGGDGMYFFGTYHRQKVFNINFAFDNMEEDTYKRMKKWLNGKEMGDLWFAEHPYKVYTAKVTGQSTMSTVCFDKEYVDETTQGTKKKRVYKGEGTVQFTAFWPYAHTPDLIMHWDADLQGYAGESIWRNFYENEWVNFPQPIQVYLLNILIGSTSYTNSITVKDTEGQEWAMHRFMYYGFTDSAVRTIEAIKFNENVTASISYKSNNMDSNFTTIVWGVPENGKVATSYRHFANWESWSTASGLQETPQPALNVGDLPTPFIAHLSTTQAALKYSFENNKCIVTGLNTTTSKIVIPSTYITTEVVAIAKEAFKGNSNIQTVVISEGISEIRDAAFSSCENLKEVIIPKSVKKIHHNAFDNCHKLERIYYDAESAEFMATDESGNPYYHVFTKCGIYTDNGTTLEIGPNVKSIPAKLFCPYSENYNYYLNITNIYIPTSITSIPDKTFYLLPDKCQINYGGTAEQWGEISKGSNNFIGSNATSHLAVKYLQPSPLLKNTITKTVYTETYTIKDADNEEVLSISIQAPNNVTYHNAKWDSKTGIVSACINSTDETTRKPIPYTGNACGALPVGQNTISSNISSIDYHYWYY